jgi:hypothetical protein
MSAENFASGLVGAAIGATGAVLSTIFTIRHESKRIEGERKAEKEKELRSLVGKYLSVSQDTVESLWHRLNDAYDEVNPEIIGKEYYQTTTLYALARFFAVKQIMMLEGAYSSIEAAYPSTYSVLLSEIPPKRGLAHAPERFLRRFKMTYNEEPGSKWIKEPGLGVRLQNHFEGIDGIINDIVEDVISKEGTMYHFYRNHRQQLGEAAMERESGQWKVSKLLDFLENYGEKSKGRLPDFFTTATRFSLTLGETAIRMKPASVSIDPGHFKTRKMEPEAEQKIMNAFAAIMMRLEKASDDLSEITGLPSGIPHNKRFLSKF